MKTKLLFKILLLSTLTLSAQEARCNKFQLLLGCGIVLNSVQNMITQKI